MRGAVARRSRWVPALGVGLGLGLGLGLACSLAVGAGCGPRGLRSGHANEERGSAVGFVRPPVVNGRRDACLAPPYAPAAGAAALADGTPIVAHQAGGRRWVVGLGGERALDKNVVVEQAVERMRAHPGLRFLGYGMYCGDGQPACLHLAGNLCEVRVGDVVKNVREAVAGEAALAGVRMLLSVELAGNLGPRCETGAAGCGPLPYDTGQAHYDPARARRAGVFPSHSAGACTQDGDCWVAGCGNHCVSWQYGGANEGATCEGYIFPRPVYCGCVSGGCGWFAQ